jgi:DNA-binding Lrp family transcriptional regulator
MKDDPGKTFRAWQSFTLMVRAFIMVKAGTGHAEALADRLGELDHVTVANVVAGNFDVIVEADAEEVYDIIHSVATRIRGLDDVEDTKTYICLE